MLFPIFKGKHASLPDETPLRRPQTKHRKEAKHLHGSEDSTISAIILEHEEVGAELEAESLVLTPEMLDEGVTEKMNPIVTLYNCHDKPRKSRCRRSGASKLSESFQYFRCKPTL